MILQMPHSFRWGDRAGIGISKILAESVYGRRQRLACYVPMSGGERQIRHFSSAFILMYTVSFIIYMTVWLTLLRAVFDFYWIYIKICGESVPLRPDKTEKIYKEPGGPYRFGKALRALSIFSLFYPGVRVHFPRKFWCEFIKNQIIRMLALVTRLCK